MGSLLKIAHPSGLGLRLEDGIQPMISAVTTAVGDVLAVKETTVNASTGLFDTMQQAATADLISGMFGVSLDAIASANGTGRFLFIGDASQALMVAATAVGADLSATNAARSLTASATTQKVIAKALTATSGAGLARLMFDGINGFGNLA